jgi:hypothetical protein
MASNIKRVILKKNAGTHFEFTVSRVCSLRLQCYIEQNPEDAAALVERIEKMITSEIQSRQPLINKFNKAGQPLRMFDRLGNGQYPLMNIIKWFMSEEALDAIEATKGVGKEVSSGPPPQTMSLLALRAANGRN